MSVTKFVLAISSTIFLGLYGCSAEARSEGRGIEIQSKPFNNSLNLLVCAHDEAECEPLFASSEQGEIFRSQLHKIVDGNGFVRSQDVRVLKINQYTELVPSLVAYSMIFYATDFILRRLVIWSQVYAGKVLNQDWKSAKALLNPYEYYLNRGYMRPPLRYMLGNAAVVGVGTVFTFALLNQIKSGYWSRSGFQEPRKKIASRLLDLAESEGSLIVRKHSDLEILVDMLLYMRQFNLKVSDRAFSMILEEVYFAYKSKFAIF
jgi:hypothetical protein